MRVFTCRAKKLKGWHQLLRMFRRRLPSKCSSLEETLLQTQIPRRCSVFDPIASPRISRVSIYWLSNLEVGTRLLVVFHSSNTSNLFRWAWVLEHIGPRRANHGFCRWSRRPRRFLPRRWALGSKTNDILGREYAPTHGYALTCFVSWIVQVAWVVWDVWVEYYSIDPKL